MNVCVKFFCHRDCYWQLRKRIALSSLCFHAFNYLKVCFVQRKSSFSYFHLLWQPFLTFSVYDISRAIQWKTWTCCSKSFLLDTHLHYQRNCRKFQQNYSDSCLNVPFLSQRLIMLIKRGIPFWICACSSYMKLHEVMFRLKVMYCFLLPSTIQDYVAFSFQSIIWDMHWETKIVLERSFYYSQIHLINNIAQYTNHAIVMKAIISLDCHRFRKC